jgi:hypothetical protein
VRIQLPNDELKGIPLGLLRVGLSSQTQVDFGHPDRESELSELVESVPQEIGGDRCELALDSKGVDWATLQKERIHIRKGMVTNFARKVQLQWVLGSVSVSNSVVGLDVNGPGQQRRLQVSLPKESTHSRPPQKGNVSNVCILSTGGKGRLK